MDKRTLLKIKAASLAAESRIIRKEEARQLRRKNEGRNNLYDSVRRHRIYDVREEARATNLALGFLRGRDYLSIENLAITQPAWNRVTVLVKKYGPQLNEIALGGWPVLYGEVWERYVNWEKVAAACIGHHRKGWLEAHSRPRPKRERVRRTLEEWQAMQREPLALKVPTAIS